MFLNANILRFPKDCNDQELQKRGRSAVGSISPAVQE